MALLNDPRFMIYTKGYYPDQLCLGHLVIGPYYHDPIEEASRCCQFPPLSEHETKEWAYCSDWKGKCIAKKGWNLSIGVEALDLCHLNPSLDWTGSKVLEAEKGRRIELKNPSEFLSEKVLPKPQVQESLKRWLSVARTNYMYHKFMHRKPKLWMLTALYELEGVKTHTISEKNPAFELSASSTLIGTASGVPLGGSVGAGFLTRNETEGEVKQPMVYAARYQLLKASYSRLGEEAQPKGIMLHPDNIYCRGYAMGEDDHVNEESDADAAILTCEEPSVDTFVEQEELDTKYWKEFAKAEKKMMARLEDE